MKTSMMILAGALASSGCASSSGTSTVRGLASELVTGGRVTDVRLMDGEAGSSEFRRAFTSRVHDRLNACARGSTPLILEISLDEFKGANVVVAALIPAQSKISGTARLLDASGETVGEYHIQRSLTAGGVVGATLAAQAETTMSQAFGDEVCKQAFGAR